MLKLECNVAVFRNLIDSIGKIVSEVVMVFTKKGVKLQCMDTNHVGLIMLSLPKTTFVKYTCATDQQLGINLTSFIKILNCAAPKDVCVLSTDPLEPDLLQVEFSNRLRAFQYSLKLMDLAYSPIDIPDRDDDVVVVFPSYELQSVIKDLSPLGAELRVQAGPTSITFNVESDTGKGTYKIDYKKLPSDNSSNDASSSSSSSSTDDATAPATANASISTAVACTEFNGSVKQLFSLKYLSNFSKACSFCDKVELRLKENQPLVIRFPLPRMSDNLIVPESGAANFGILLFFLAPKVEDTTQI